MIHDVTTDPEEPPQFIALREARLASPNGVAYSGSRVLSHSNLEPKFFALPHSAVFQAAIAVANTMQWKVAAAVEAEGRIEATATTRLLRFKDDVVIRIRPTVNGARLDIRSASRLGSSDFGTNARRIHAFLRELNKHLKINT